VVADNCRATTRTDLLLPYFFFLAVFFLAAFFAFFFVAMVHSFRFWLGKTGHNAPGTALAGRKSGQ
jgi:hypothetical protein